MLCLFSKGMYLFCQGSKSFAYIDICGSNASLEGEFHSFQTSKTRPVIPFSHTLVLKGRVRLGLDKHLFSNSGHRNFLV